MAVIPGHNGLSVIPCVLAISSASLSVIATGTPVMGRGRGNVLVGRGVGKKRGDRVRDWVESAESSGGSGFWMLAEPSNSPLPNDTQSVG